jgi:AhpC/TSA family protein
MLEISQTAPTFALLDTEGVLHHPRGVPATVVVFTCNHCPYALAWHERLIEVAEAYAARGVVTFAINSNDADRYPRDSEEAMRERVQAGDFVGVTYLRDESQDVARAYAAERTPEVFVLDSELILRYHGALDDDYEDPSQRASYLRDALDAVLDGQAPALAETEPVGCSIKWKPQS